MPLSVEGENERKMRRTNFVLAVIAILSFLLMILALFLQIRSERELRQAQHDKIEARYKEVLATTDLSLALEEKKEAEAIAEEAKEKEAEALKKANDSQVKARVTEKKLLTTSTDLERVKAESEEAIKQKERLLKLRMLTLGKSLAVRSLNYSSERDIQTLLAYQAYKFNTRYDGSPIDHDIYTGLYEAVKSGTGRKVYRGNDDVALSVAWVPGSKDFFTAGSDGRILKWDVNGNGTDYSVIYAGMAKGEVLAVSRDASWIAYGEENSVIRMIPLKSNNIAYELKGHKGKISSLVFSHDGSALYSASYEGELFRWDLKAKTHYDISTNRKVFISIDISHSGQFLAGVDSGGELSVWTLMDKETPFKLDLLRSDITKIRFKPEEGYLALGSESGVVEIWDVRLRRKVAEIETNQGRISDISFNHILKQIATSGDDGTVKIWNEANPDEPPLILSDNDGTVLSVTYSPDGRMFLTATNKSNNLVQRPASADDLAKDICVTLNRNLSKEEWLRFVARDVPYEETCTDQDRRIRVIEKR